MLIEPHGQNSLVSINDTNDVSYSKTIIVPDFIKYDIELICNGAFTPLTGFMNFSDLDSVVKHMRLSSGLIWSIPISLQIDTTDLEGQETVLLRSEESGDLAIIQVEELFKYPLEEYVLNVFGTQDPAHPGVKKILSNGNSFVAGKVLKKCMDLTIEGIDSSDLLTPRQTRDKFFEKGWSKVVSFQTRNPIHRAHEYIIKVAQETVDGLLIHPLVGATKSDDISASTRNLCYKELISNYFNPEHTMLSYLPANINYAGPREAIHHMIIRKNYGCSHMIIGRDHAGVGDYYGTYEAQELVDLKQEILGIQAVKFEHSFYCKKCETMASQKTCPHGHEDHVHLSGTKVRQLLSEGTRPPKEFSRPEIADILIREINEK